MLPFLLETTSDVLCLAPSTDRSLNGNLKCMFTEKKKAFCVLSHVQQTTPGRKSYLTVLFCLCCQGWTGHVG